MKKIQHYHFEQILKKGYSLDIVYILTQLSENKDIKSMCKSSKKIEILYNTIVRKGLYSEETNKITVEGDELLLYLNEKNVSAPLKVTKSLKDSEYNFDVWWSNFPSNNAFVYKGMSFKATRSFKAKKKDCKKLFENIVNDKKFTMEQIIKATLLDINFKKEASFKKRENQLTFLQNTYTYLYQEIFEGFVDLIDNKQDEEISVVSRKGGTDI